MIPIKDDNPTRSFPLFTVLLLIANVAVFLYQVVLGFEGNDHLIGTMGMIPLELTSRHDALPHSPIPLLLTPITSMFLHGDFFHLGGNMLYLWIFGNNVEDELGKIRFLVFYFACGLAAAFTHVATAPSSPVPVIGASGAISGVLGAYIVMFPRARVLTLIFIFFFIRLIWLPAVVVLGLWFVVQLVSGLPTLGSAGQAGVAWFAHVGGFVTGAVIVGLGRRRRRRLPRIDWS